MRSLTIVAICPKRKLLAALSRIDRLFTSDTIEHVSERIHLMPELTAAKVESDPRLFQISVSIGPPVLNRSDVARNREMCVLLEDLVDRCDSCEAGFVGKSVIRSQDSLLMFRFEEGLRPLASHFVHGIDKQDPALARSRLARTADDDAGLHRRVVEQVRA